MIKALIWKTKQWLNKIQGEYADDQLQKELKIQSQILQWMQDEEQVRQHINMFCLLQGEVKGNTLREVAKTIRTKGKIKEVSKKST